MTTISAKVVADSVSDNGDRLTTMELVYPRFIHAELMTHRQFSRNASSSRAIPVERQIQMIKDDPVVPLYWGKNQKGMQASEECDAKVDLSYLEDYPLMENLTREQAWIEAKDKALIVAEAFNKAGYHKQIVNRLLEPFAHIKVLVSSTEWENFFLLRLHEFAEPHIQHLAREMLTAYQASIPKHLSEGMWHMPYVSEEELDAATDEHGVPIEEAVEVFKMVSSARCARVSYLNFNGTSSADKDIELCTKLMSSDPIHASPFEHVATPMRGRYGNFEGFRQYRQELEDKSEQKIGFEEVTGKFFVYDGSFSVTSSYLEALSWLK